MAVFWSPSPTPYKLKLMLAKTDIRYHCGSGRLLACFRVFKIVTVIVHIKYLLGMRYYTNFNLHYGKSCEVDIMAACQL